MIWEDPYLLRRAGFAVLVKFALIFLESATIITPSALARFFVAFPVGGVFIIPAVILSKGDEDPFWFTAAFHAAMFVVGLVALLSATPLSLAAVLATGPLVFGSPIVTMLAISEDFAKRVVRGIDLHRP